jgi:hypothetical protein
MNPTVMAAAIGVGGTVLVGVAGFGAAIWNTRRTIAHARESRIWDRRADVYVEALAALHYRHVVARSRLVDEETEKAMLAGRQQPEWPALEARLQAFASEPVFMAVEASSRAHRAAGFAFGMWRKADDDIHPGFGKDAMEKGRAAEAADKVAVELIRTELHGRGLPLGDWEPTLLVEAPHRAPEDSGETEAPGNSPSPAG